MIAPPGYPNITSTPASTRVRHRICAPLRSSLIRLHAPEVAVGQRRCFESVGVIGLVQRVHQRARARLYDIRGGAVTAERLAVDPHLQYDASQAVASWRTRYDG